MDNGESVVRSKGLYTSSFKTDVINYAASHTYKDTGLKFNIHCTTVSEWVKQNKTNNSNTSEPEQLIAWLSNCRKNGVSIIHSELMNKLTEMNTFMSNRY